MAISIQIPGLLRLVVVREPAKLEAMNMAADIDRPLSGRGGFVNRWIVSKLQPFRTPAGETWPAFCSHLDPLREQRTTALEKKLSDVPAQLQRLSGEIAELAAYVRGTPASRPVGEVVQQAVGRIFFDDYRASSQSYEAARTLSAWLAAGLVKTLLLRLSGKVPVAVDTVLTHARGNTACAHGTGLALHNIVESIGLMRNLAQSGSRLKELSPPDAVSLTLRAPKRVLREARDATQVEGIRVRARSIVLLYVESARRRGSDPGIAFLTDQRNQCPAHVFVPALLGEVWKTARA
jgi:hypothetical protein